MEMKLAFCILLRMLLTSSLFFFGCLLLLWHILIIFFVWENLWISKIHLRLLILKQYSFILRNAGELFKKSWSGTYLMRSIPIFKIIISLSLVPRREIPTFVFMVKHRHALDLVLLMQMVLLILFAWFYCTDSLKKWPRPYIICFFTVSVCWRKS